MARLPHIVRKRKKSKIMGSPEVIRRQDIEAMQVDARLDLIRALIPLGLSFVMEELDREVVSLAGAKHSRKAGDDVPRRHGSNPGSVKLAGQSVPIRVPRLRAYSGHSGQPFRLIPDTHSGFIRTTIPVHSGHSLCQSARVTISNS